MSRPRVSAAAIVAVAVVLFASACSNDFDELFAGADGGEGAGDAGTDSAKGNEKDAGLPAECVRTCEPKISQSDSATTLECPSCACSCPKLVCGDTAKECSGTCESGSSCAAFCSASSKCSLECAKGASCVLTCAKGLPCDLLCASGKTVACEGGVLACNAECPK